MSNRYYGKKFLNMGVEDVAYYNIDKHYDIEIYIVAFNNSELIYNQFLFLKKHCKDEFKIIIADNSSNKTESQKIKGLCKKYNSDYYKLPKSNQLQLSWSHGYVLNFLMKNFILKSDIPYFGLIDHDCFLIKDFSFVSKLKKQKLYGLLRDEEPLIIGKWKLNSLGNRWIIRPGCSFFDKKVFDLGYDFTPNKRYIPLSFLDTGGGNWKYVFKNFDKTSLNLLSRKVGYESGGNFEYIDDVFFHIGGAGYKDKNFVKMGLGKLMEYKK